MRQVQRMLCSGLIHGDLSEYNVLAAADGPVIIDLPQAVNAAGNNAARGDAAAGREQSHRHARRDLHRNCARRDSARNCGGCSSVASCASIRCSPGRSSTTKHAADVDGVQQVIDDARDEDERRRRGREEAEGLLGVATAAIRRRARTVRRSIL